MSYGCTYAIATSLVVGRSRIHPTFMCNVGRGGEPVCRHSSGRFARTSDVRNSRPDLFWSPRPLSVPKNPCKPCKNFFIDLVCTLNTNRTVEGCLPSVDDMILWRLEVPTSYFTCVLTRMTPCFSAHSPLDRHEHRLRARLLHPMPLASL